MLTLKALRCVNLRNVAQGSAERQDPYVTLTLQENPKLHSKTDVCYSGGVNPQWFSGNWMRLPVPQAGMTCLVQVWDKHSQDADELIASGSLRLGRYDEDGAEEEPMSIDLSSQNGIPAGQFHCVFSYDPPVGNVSARQLHPVPTKLDTSSYAHFQAANATPMPNKFMPWLNVQIRHKSGKVKDFLVSKSRAGLQQGYSRGRGYVDTRLPQVRSMAYNRYDQFRSRSILQQAVMIAAVILLVVMPWPRALVYWMFSSLSSGLSFAGSTMYDWTSGFLASMNNAASTVFSYFATAAGYMLRTMWNFSWYIGLYAVLPAVALLCMPRLLGLAMTKIGTMVLGGNLVSFGTVTFVPWVTDLKRLKFRFILVDFMLGNPRDRGFTPRFVSFNRFEFVGSVAFADFWNFVTFTPQPCPLKDVQDFRKLTSLRVDHMELDGLSINLEVNDKNKLNVLDFISSIDRAQVNRALALKELTSSSFRFPNCFEVQVLGARNLRSRDRNGLSDPFYSVQVRKQHIESDTVVKTLNPNFPPRVEQFYVDDPSAVVSIQLRDEDVMRPSDFLGQWNTTAKWLLIDPNKCKHVEWDVLTEDDRRQGWVGFWAPLVDESFRSEGTCGDVHLRLRWVYNPALPEVRPGDRRESQTPLQQLNQARKEIRQRLGDLERIFDILKHIPVLIDYQGIFVLNDTKLSIHDVLFGRRREADNVVKKIMVKHRERTDKRVASVMKEYPRSLDVKETPTALDRDKVRAESPVQRGLQRQEAEGDVQFVEKRTTTTATVPPVDDQLHAIDTPFRGVLYPERGTFTSASMEQQPAQSGLTSTTSTTTTPGTTVMMAPTGAMREQTTTTMPTTTPKNDGIDEVIITSANPNNPALPRDLDVQIDTTTGTGGVTATTGSSTPAMISTSSNQQQQQSTSSSSAAKPIIAPFNYTPTHSGYKKPASTDFGDKDVMSTDEREQFQRQRERELQQRQRDTAVAGTTTVNTAGTNTSWLTPAQQSQATAPITTSQRDLKETIVSELGSGDKLNAVYPEKLVSSAPFGDKGYVRGELAGLQENLGYSDDVYLGTEEDDEAAEQRNEDRFDDDDREYDQDGREFIKIRPIVWRRQFLARHGDPGLNLYKFLERLVRGLIPKLAADSRLQKALAGSTLKSILKGELTSSDDASKVSGAAPVDPGAQQHGVKGAIKSAAHAVKDQAKLVEKKLFHHSQDAQLQTDPKRPVTTYAEGDQQKNFPYVREGDESESVPDAKDAPATRPVHGQDADFNKNELVIAGGLEAVWQGRHRITSLFRRWKSWHVEIKGDTVYYHKTGMLSALSSGTASAADAVWYTLDLTWIQDIYLTDSHRELNNELVLRFAQDDHTLHFRLPSRTTTPTLQEWLAAFKRVQQVQQERSRLGSTAESPKATSTMPRTTTKTTTSTASQQTSSWPGEDIEPQPRSRGSSLAVPPTRDVNLVTPTQQVNVTTAAALPKQQDTTPYVQQQPDTSYFTQSQQQQQPVMTSSTLPQSSLSSSSMQQKQPEVNISVKQPSQVEVSTPMDKTKTQVTYDVTADPNYAPSVAQS